MNMFEDTFESFKKGLTRYGLTFAIMCNDREYGEIRLNGATIKLSNNPINNSLNLALDFHDSRNVQDFSFFGNNRLFISTNKPIFYTGLNRMSKEQLSALKVSCAIFGMMKIDNDSVALFTHITRQDFKLYCDIISNLDILDNMLL